jgi:hypothetical protein
MHIISVLINGQAVNDENGEVNVAFDHDHEPTQPATDTIPGSGKEVQEGEDNPGRSLWMRIMVKAVLASTQPCSLVSMVGSYTPLLSACR